MADGNGEGLTHLDALGRAQMVDVGHKPATERAATARGRILMKKSTWELVQGGQLAKGDALAVARIAGIMAAKETPRLIPLCHTVPLSSVRVVIEGPAQGAAAEGAAGTGEAAEAEVTGPDGEGRVPIVIEATARTTAQTGVEMEALTAVSVAALALYDMCKAHDRAMVIEEIVLVEKTGGVRGDYRRAEG